MPLRDVTVTARRPSMATRSKKLRRAMVRPGRDRLSGQVEVDETFVGGVEAGGGRRHLGNKALVLIAAQLDGKRIGRTRLSRIADTYFRSLVPFVRSAVEAESVVITDGWQGYEGLERQGEGLLESS